MRPPTVLTINGTSPLNGVLPKLLPDGFVPVWIVFQGKQDLDKRLMMKVRGWLRPNSSFVVLRDKDSSDCYKLKKMLTDKLIEAGRPNALVRIACHELESFYIGDLAAVESGLEKSKVGKLQQKSKYRVPDNVANPAEELYKITEGEYQKIAGSRAIAPYLSLDGTNRSRSFNVLIEGIRRIINEI